MPWFFTAPSWGPCGCLPLPLFGGCRCLCWRVLPPFLGGVLWVTFSAFRWCGLTYAEIGAVVSPALWWALWVMPPVLPG